MRSGGLPSERVHGERFRTTLICVDDGGGGEISGRLCNPYQEEGTAFSGTLDMLDRMESLLDQMQLPQAFTAARCFAGAVEPSAVQMIHGTGRRGTRATFAVRVLFRQNASWQGSVTWIEGRREESFRSVLELLLLMKNALDQQEQTV